MSTEMPSLTSLPRPPLPADQAMVKYLRYLDHHFTDAEGGADPAFVASIGPVGKTGHLGWMYEKYATPVPSNGVSKLNIYFTAAEVNQPPYEVLQIASVFQRFDGPHFSQLSSADQQRYFVDLYHAAVLKCAAHFGWERELFLAAYERIIQEKFDFAFSWKKPLASPNRKLKTLAFIQVSPLPAHLYLLFFDHNMQELQRVLLSVGVNGPGVVEFVLGDIRWEDEQTVRVEHKNGRDYWLCHVDGTLSFHFPRAENGDAHGEFELGRMYFEGSRVLKDTERGLQLIRSAAAKGWKHAQNFLRSTEAQSAVDRTI